MKIEKNNSLIKNEEYVLQLKHFIQQRFQTVFQK